MKTWPMIVTGADADPNTSAYDEVNTADILTANGYTNNTSATVYITAPQFKWKYEQVEYTGSDGTKRTITKRRKSWDVVCYPHTYAAGTEPDLDDIDTLSAVLVKNFLWVNIQAGSRNYPTTTTKSLPVTFAPDTQDSVDFTGGSRTLTLTLLHRFRV